jgi:Fe-S-cluster containining protein
MNLPPDPLLTIRNRYLPLLDRLAGLFDEMSHAYSTVAAQYGFRCNGCADNCCLTRFYHHTLIEYLYLAEGLRTIEPGVQRTIKRRAQTVSARTEDADRRGESLRIMCPLNTNDRCMLYPYRPMICRLHGIPHELHRPDGRLRTHPGCDAFFDQCRESGKIDYIRFDRTPFYLKMAALEKALRKEMGYFDRFRATIAQMLVAIMDSTDEIN